MGFQALAEEIVYRGKVFNLAKLRFRLSNGKELTYDLVQHRGAVVVIPIDAEGNILFVRQFRIGAEQALLELPAGLLEEDELPEDCASREAQEETGMAPGKLEKLGEFFMTPGYSTEKIQVFLATQLYKSSLPTDEDEFIEQVSIPAKDAYQMARDGKLLDGKTLAALFLAFPKIFPQR
ncbi:MAG: NUDIX hydrolase [Anaerolineaceae bacterium]|nr:NUDIX hydrolase [Anaerolineaceae bacterium]